MTVGHRVGSLNGVRWIQFFLTFVTTIFVCDVWKWEDSQVAECVQDSGQICDVDSLSSLCGSQGWNSGRQTCTVSGPAEPSSQS